MHRFFECVTLVSPTIHLGRKMCCKHSTVFPFVFGKSNLSLLVLKKEDLGTNYNRSNGVKNAKYMHPLTCCPTLLSSFFILTQPNPNLPRGCQNGPMPVFGYFKGSTLVSHVYDESVKKFQILKLDGFSA